MSARVCRSRRTAGAAALVLAISISVSVSPLFAAEKKGSSARARGNLVGLFSDSDYPRQALARDEQGTVAVRLRISTAGRVSGCTVMQSASPLLDARTCAVLTERAFFAPARLKNGRPITDTFKQRVTWRIPDYDSDDDTPLRPIVPFADRTIDRVIVFRNGKLESCRASFTPVLADADGAEAQLPCAEASAHAAQLLADAPAAIGQSFRMVIRLHASIGTDRLKLIDYIDGPLEAHFIKRLTVNANGSPTACDNVSRFDVRFSAELVACVPDRTRFPPLKPDEPSNNRIMMMVETVRYERL